MTRLLLIFVIVTSAILTAAGSPDRTTRRGLKAVRTTAAATTARCDTVTPSPGMIDVSGYDKPLRSSRETLFVTNRSARTLTAVELCIIYLDAKGRQLHERTIWLPADIPAGETRRINFRSWDVQRTFYYRLTGRPRRSDGTVYDVSIRPIRAVFPAAGASQSSEK